jgi:Fic/DOC family/Helix-turn-helix domain
LARRISDEELQAIIDAAAGHDGASAQDIARERDIPLRTAQYRLKVLVEAGRLVTEGKGPSAKYRLPPEGEQLIAGQARIAPQGDLFIPVSKQGAEIQKYVRKPPEARKPVGYQRDFLNGYRPNKTAYLSQAERDHLRKVGTPQIAAQPAGTYAKHILNRLLIDLSWNSSRLEGNTYSLLDTKRLIDLGEQPEGKDQLEAQMILNHKDAIEFLVSEAEEVGFNRYTILNLHGMLANNLLPDPDAPGRLRHIGVAIDGSVFEPLAVPAMIEECFDQVLATAAAIDDPFEQAFFVMVQLPYLQPFDDVNKRVSRLAANIPLIRGNLCPLSFIDVPKETYTQAMLGVYELNKVDLLKDIFIWGYERSASRYAAVRQSLGEPDPFRLRLRAELRTIIGAVVRGRMDKKKAATHIASWTAKNIADADRAQFREIAETELSSLHEGNFARYQIKPSEFKLWRDAWVVTRS